MSSTLPVSDGVYLLCCEVPCRCVFRRDHSSHGRLISTEQMRAGSTALCLLRLRFELGDRAAVNPMYYLKHEVSKNNRCGSSSGGCGMVSGVRAVQNSSGESCRTGTSAGISHGSLPRPTQCLLTQCQQRWCS
ncbi:Uncharacterized protein DAT39_002806 [Clarias magur]|uniref:Uncharacterized protein n=1 Tax=Clarias magur TaxID=1594786 RepID=A0A8J4UVD9_CLAMG|nr:Uncharacterized protein DAT39_002806 [Clarias magur]